MSRHLHLDLVGGLSGDIWLGLLLDLGLDLGQLRSLPGRLGLEQVEVGMERVERCGLIATHAIVTVGGEEEPPAPVAGPGRGATSESHRHAHGHDHAHDHAHGRDHLHDPVDGPATASHGRNWAEVRAAIERADLPAAAARTALRAAERLFAAEAAVHGRAIEQVHLHEAGADDALVDLCGTALGLTLLEIESVSCSLPLPVGGGLVHCAHGLMPVPVPAVSKLLEGVAVQGGPIARETITPTGAALLVALDPVWGPLPAMTIERTGHGAGRRDDPTVPNLARGVVGRLAAGPLRRTVAVLETTLDDLLPQDLPVLIDQLLARGARDASVQTVAMKKGRIGFRLSAICDPHEAESLARFLLERSPTLGVRIALQSRLEWARDTISVATPWGAVRVKRALDSAGAVRHAQPEFEDCRALAENAGVAIDEVRRSAERALEDEDPD